MQHENHIYISASELTNNLYNDFVPIDLFYYDHKSNVRRINVVVDNINLNNPFDDVNIYMVLLTSLAQNCNASLRIVQYNLEFSPKIYYDMLKIYGLTYPNDISFFSVRNKKYKLDVHDKDEFFVESWKMAQVIRNTFGKDFRFYYFLQSVPSFNCIQGYYDYLSFLLMKDNKIDYIVGSKFLFNYLEKHNNIIAKNGIYIETVFPKLILEQRRCSISKKCKLLFWVKSCNTCFMFEYGISVLDYCIKIGIIDTKIWDIYIMYQDGVSSIEFCNGYRSIILDALSYNKFVDFLKTVDLAICLHDDPSYIYLINIVASLGGVVVTNKCRNMFEQYVGDNVFLSDLNFTNMVNMVGKGVLVSRDIERRRKTYQLSVINMDMQKSLQPIIKLWEKNKKNV